MFLRHEDLEKVRVSSLLSLVANTGLGLVLQPHEPARKYNGTGTIWVSESAMELLAIFTTTTTAAAMLFVFSKQCVLLPSSIT